jgi:DNA polymerase delta subunit 1
MTELDASFRGNNEEDAIEPRVVRFKTYYWNYEETEDHELFIHVGGRTEDGLSVHTVIKGFTPFVYLQLPKRIKWNKAKCIAVFDYLKKVMKSEGPLNFWLLKKYLLKHKQLCNTMCLTFPTNKAAYSLSRKCYNRSGMVIDGVGTFRPSEFEVHEQNIDPILKFTASKKLDLAGWIEVKETIPDEEVGLSVEDRKFTTADIDLQVEWTDVEAYTPKEIVILRPIYLSFDIECYSRNHNSKLPDPDIPENCVFQIACTIGKFGEPIEKSYLLSFGSPLDIPGVEVIRFNQGDMQQREKDLLLYFKRLVDEINPDLFITYNGMKFDWNYMIKRAERLGIYMKFAQISRIIGRRAELKKTSWSSSAYGEQEFRYLDPFGRTNVDVMIEIERNYKLPQYGLNVVAEFFLKEHKDDVTPRQLFMLYQLTEEFTPIVDEMPNDILPRDERIALKRQIQDILQMRRCHGEVKKLRTSLMNAKTGKEFKNLVRKAFAITGKYCVQDTVLPVKIAEKLNLWITMEEMSNCMSVPMSYLHTRGQQIKVLSQIYRETIFNDIIIPFRKKQQNAPTEKYQGAVVIEANPGDYENVVCYDFESLYPTTIIAFNICYTTLLEDDDPTPDEECHVLEWHDHVACSHDPQKRKKKEADVLCKKHRYRFKKVVTLPDGTRLNEGLMPRLERKLLSERKIRKKEMAKLEATLKMATGVASEDDITFYKKMGWDIIQKGSLSAKQIDILKVGIAVRNAQQLSLKVSSNSAYGGMGAQNGFIPLVPGAASVTAMGRMLIMKAIKFIQDRYDFSKLVYGDTDSSMITFKGKSTEESFLLGDRISKEASHFLKTFLLGFDENYEIECPADGVRYRIDKYPRDKMDGLADESKIHIYQYDYNPINLQFENLYKRYLLLSKKRYVAYAVNRKGEIINTIKKGVVLARRDNSQYLRDTYKVIVGAILDRKDEMEVMYELYDHVSKLFTRQIPDANLIVYTGVKNIMNYAKKKEVKNGRTVLDRVFLDEDKEPIDDPIGPLDPRLVYPNLPQVLLSLKMLRRGDDVPPNTRLEYLYVENDEATHQGEKAEDYTFYRENKDIFGFKPDYLHYIEKQLTNPITELLDVKYPREKVAYEKIDDALDRCINGLDDLLKHRVLQTKKYERSAGERYDTLRCGWSALGCDECRTKFPKKCTSSTDKISHNPKTKVITYYYTKRSAQVQFILDSISRKKANPKAINEIDEKKYPELIRVCRRWKAWNIINSVHAKYGIRKRSAKRPTQTGEKLRLKTKETPTQVLLSSSYGGYAKGTLATLKDIREEIVETSLKGKKNYFYSLQMPDEIILNDVPRSAFTTYYYKDGSVMKDILLARGNYKSVCEELKMLFSPLIFEGERKEAKIFEVAEEYDE